MKARLLLPLLLMAALFCTPGAAFAADLAAGTQADDGWTVTDFIWSDDKATVTGLSDSGREKLLTNTNLVIPSQNDGVDVTAIGNGVTSIGTFGYKDADGVTHVPTQVTLPNKLKKIGNSAFSAVLDNATGEQVGLTSVQFPETLEEIGQMAFQNAPLTSVMLPDSVTTLGTGVFTTVDKTKVKIEDVKLSKSLRTIPQAAFTSQAIKNIEIPKGVEVIGRNAFKGNFSESVVIPDTVKTIEQEAFGNHQFESLDIPASVETIGNYAFRVSNADHPSVLTKVTLGGGLVSIGNEAFGGNKIEEVTIPASLTTLSASAFKNNANAQRKDGKVAIATASPAQANGGDGYSKVAAGTWHILYYPAKISFDANGGAVETESANVNPDKKLDSLPTPKKPGYIFVEWQLDGAAVTADAEYADDATLVAQWELDAETPKNVSDQIDALNSQITLADKDAVESALQAYEDLVDEQKALVGNPVKVYAAATTIAKLELADAQEAQKAAEKKAADAEKAQKAAEEKATAAAAKAVTLKKATLTSKTKSAKKGKVTVAWKKVAGASGYEVQVGSKTYTVKSAKTLNKTYKAAKGKKVSVKVRAYKKQGTNTLYGPWSKAKKVKVKK